MFDYEVLTEEQALQERFQLLKEGEYDAVIVKSEDKVSANGGNPMMDMTLSVYDDNGKPHDVRDFLVFTRSMMWKVRACADSADLIKEYEEKKFCSEIIQNKGVRVRITIEKGALIPEDKLNGKASGSKYPDKNKIDNYVHKADQKPLTTAKVDMPFDDDLPF